MYINKHTGNIGILHSITTVVKVNDKDILRVCQVFLIQHYLAVIN